METPNRELDKERHIMAVASKAITKAGDQDKKIKWSKHSFQIREDILKEFLDFANTLGVKKYEALEEAIGDYFDKHGEVVKKIRDIKANRDV
jgi:hypothetical protein